MVVDLLVKAWQPSTLVTVQPEFEWLMRELGIEWMQNPNEGIPASPEYPLPRLTVGAWHQDRNGEFAPWGIVLWSNVGGPDVSEFLTGIKHNGFNDGDVILIRNREAFHRTRVFSASGRVVCRAWIREQENFRNGKH